jgi:hypothetical protein
MRLVYSVALVEFDFGRKSQTVGDESDINLNLIVML